MNTITPRGMARLASVVTLVGLAVALSGCAAIEAEQVRETEQKLSAAGFEMKVADTPEKLAHLQTLTQHKVVRHQRDGELQFVYADAEAAKCVYIGDEAAYQRFQKLQVEQSIADENEDASMDWGLWDRPSW